MEYKQGQELREFSHLYKKMEELYHSLSLKIGLSDSAFSILYTICEGGDGCSQTYICGQICASKQTINSAIQKLERQGLLCLRKGENGRERRIYLTEAGRKLVRERIHPIMAMEDRAFVRMPREERAELLRLTRKYAMAMLEEAQAVLGPEERA